MDERINKPRVFLSHSKKNIDFITRLAVDLRKCHIDPWLDTDQIRHGKSWQDSIFEFGLPTCDAIIVYLTEVSIQSPVVKKEIDVALLQNLEDNNVAFLPYVSNEKIRSELRPDLQALQTPVWNEENYTDLLPRVVAEIWRSYLERTVLSATKNERLKRIEAELEIEKYKNSNDAVFSGSEEKEFEYIYKHFDKFIEVTGPYPQEDDHPGRSDEHIAKFNLQLSTLVALLSDFQSEKYSEDVIVNRLFYEGMKLLNIEFDFLRHSTYRGFAELTRTYDLTENLLTFGLIDRYNPVKNFAEGEYVDKVYLLSKKYYRYRYWLAYNKKLPQKVIFETVAE